MSFLRLKATRVLPCFLPPLLLILAASWVARAQTGSVSFGTVALGQSSGSQTVTLTFSSAGTAAAPQALTLGAQNQDFALVSGGNCAAGQSYAVGATCTEVVTFTPKGAGLRRGAVVIADGSGNVLATAYLSGAGSGPQAGLRVLNSTVSFAGLGVSVDQGIAADGKGNFFVAVENTTTARESVFEVPDSCDQAACMKQLAGTFGGVWGLAVDGAGNVWVGDPSANGTITEILAAGGYSATKSYSGAFGNQIGVAVDGLGNVFFISARIEYATSVFELTSASNYQTLETLATDIQNPGGIGVDASGDVFYVDSSVKGVEEIAAVNGTIPATPTVQTVASGINTPLSVAVDGSGSLFVTTTDNIDEVSPANAYSGFTTYSGLAPCSGIALDGAGDIFVSGLVSGLDNQFNPTETGTVFEIPRTAATAITFPDPTAPGETDTVDGTQTVYLENIGNEALNLANLAITNNNYFFDPSTTCSTSTTLAAGESCTMGVVFDPIATGNPATATVNLTDNSGNQASAQQSIALSGTSLYTPTISEKGSLVIAVTQSLALTITVHGASAGPTPTGTVQFSALGYTGSPVTLSNGQASVTAPAGSLTPGTGAYTIEYQPDTAGAMSYLPLLANGTLTVTETLENQPQVEVLPAVQQIATGQALTVQVNVTQANGSPAPTGSVTLFAGSYTSAPVTLSGASASFTIPANSLPIGNALIEVVYTPDAASLSIYLSSNGDAVVSVLASVPPAGGSPVAFGTLGIGVASAPIPVTLVFPTGGTPAGLIAATQGATGLDFALAGGGSCGAGVYVAPGGSCTANVIFTPAYPGLRNGAVVALDGNGAALASTYIYGSGTGAQLAIESVPEALDYLVSEGNEGLFPSSSTQLGSGYSWPRVTTDSAGDVYVSDEGNNRIQKFPAGCASSSCAITITTGIMYPAGMAVDGAGNLFVTELGYNDVKEIPLGCQSISCMITVGAGFNQPNGLSVDASGNVFVADTGNGAIREVVAAGGYATINTLATGLDSPWSVVVDASDNLFVALGGDQCQVYIPPSCSTINTSIVEITAASSYTTVNTLIPPNQLGKPLGLAIDGSGNVYEADYGDGCSNEIIAASGYQKLQRWCLDASGSGLFFTAAVALGRASNGSIAWGDVNKGAVFLNPFNQQPSIVFNTATQNGTSDYVDGAQLIYVFNNGNEPLTLSEIALSDPSFHFDSTDTTCSTSKPVAAGGNCAIGVDFAPEVYGPISATLTLISNNLNQNAVPQVIPITAVALPPTPVILTTPPSTTTATSATFTFSDTQSPITFVCSIDSLPYSACSSPATFNALSGGLHSFEVKAADAVGNLSPAAGYSWTINSVGPPAPVITSGPNPISFTSAAAFTFTDTRSGVSFQCSLNGAAFAPCASGVSYTVTGSTSLLVMTYYTFAVEAQDATGVSPDATYSWVYEPSPDEGEGSGVNFGPIPVGQSSAPQTLTFTILGSLGSNPNDTVASVSVYTLGVSGLDFAVTNPGTCAVGSTVTRDGTCTLQANFTPQFAGQRKGAVVLLDASGAMISMAYIQGTGTAPQLTFTPYSTASYNLLPPQNNSDPGKNLVAPATDVALDGAGNLYVSDDGIFSVDGTISVSVGDIWKFAPGCTSPSCSTLFATDGRTGSSAPNNSAVLAPQGMYLDGAGLIWLAIGELGAREANLNGSWVSWECNLPNYGTWKRPAVDGNGLASLIVDGGINLCGTELGTFSFSTNTPSMTVDPQGNLFVADAGNNDVGEVLASSNYAVARVVASGFNNPSGIASDAFGNIFVADTGNNAIKELTAASGYTQIVTVASFTPGTINLGNLAVDAVGNLYVANYSAETNEAMKIDFADVPALSFPTATLVGSTDTADGTLTATVQNSGNEPLSISGLAISGSGFQLDASATTCAAGTTLTAGNSCIIGVFFAPQTTGALTGTVTLTDNALNATAATQVFALSGSSVTQLTTAKPTLTVMPANASITTAQSDVVTVTVSGSSGSPMPTGIVTLSGGNYTSASIALSGGSASFTIPPGVLALGSNTVNAVYAPDAASVNIYSAATGSAPITVTSVPTSTPTVSVTPALLDVSTAQSLQVTISVNGGTGNPTPTGSVTLSGGNYASLAVTLVNGSASITIPSGYLPAGMVTLSAYYTPDAPGATNFNSASGTGQVEVEAAPLVTPLLTVTPAINPTVTTQPLGVTLVVAGGSGNPVPTGSVVLSTGSYTSMAAPISQGSVILTIPAGTLGGGSNTLSAVYTPDKASALTYNSATGTSSVTTTGGQLITFAQPASPVTYAPGLTIPLSATGGASGNPVVLTLDAASTGLGSITGSTLNVTSPGTFVIDANQAGNSSYTAAPQVQRTVVVTQIAQSINFTQPSSPVIYTPGLTIPLSATGGASGNPVVFSIDASSTGTGSISGSTLTVTAAGNFVIDANQAGNVNYSAAPQVQRTVVVSALTAQAITFSQPASPVTYAAGLTIPLSATGGASGNPVIFSIDAASTGTGSITGSTLNVTAAGTFVIDANQAGSSSYSAAPQVQRTIVVSQAAQVINFTQPTSPVTYSSGLQITLSATGGASGSPVVFTIDSSSTGTGSISGSTLTIASVGNFVIDANQAGNADYSAATQVQRTVVVSALIAQAINFTQPTTPVTYSSGLTIPLVATGGGSGNAVVFTIDASSTGAGTISGSTLTVTSVGSFVIDANQAGSSSYSAAPQVQRTIVVSQAAQVINFTQPTSPVTYSSGLQITLSATGGASGNPVVFTIDSSSTGTGTISGGTLTVTSAGNFVIDANQAGNADYSAAVQVQRTIAVTAPAPDFSVDSTTTSQSVAPGASAMYSINVADVGSAFTGTVTLSVSGLPTGATGSFSPPTVTPGSEGGSSTLTVTIPDTASVVRPNFWPVATPVLALLFMLPFRRWRKVWRGKLLLLITGLASLIFAASLTGCGGGFGFNQSQTYTLTITGTSGADTHSTTVQLTVQ